MIRQLCSRCDAVIEFFGNDAEHAAGPKEIGWDGTPAAPLRGLCGGCGEAVVIRPCVTINTASPLELPRRRVTWDGVFLPAMDVMRRYARPVFLLSAWTGLLWISVVLLGGSLLWRGWQVYDVDRSSRAALVTGTVLWIAASFAVSGYVAGVLSRASLGWFRYPESCTDRRQVDRFGMWRVPLTVTMRLTSLYFFAAMVLLAAMGCGLAGLVFASLIAHPEVALPLGVIGVSGLLVTTAGLLQGCLWPAVFLISDERTDLTTGVVWSVRLMLRYRRLGVTILTSYMMLSTLGTLSAYVGQIFTTPLFLLPMASAYLRMTAGQRAA